MSDIDSCVKKGFRSIGDSFRGEIWENCKRFKLLGGAYSSMPVEQRRYFDIATANHLRGPLKALKDPGVRTVIIIGATQVMKSIVGDIWCPFILEHDPRNLLVLFETDKKAQEFCDIRLMETIKGHPVLKEQIEEVNRHDVTKTDIKLPTMDMKVGGLNESNASSLSWPNIWISEAWQHGSDGLLKKGIKRADRFPDTCKILIESQAGLHGEDLHQEVLGAHPVHCTWSCPLCQGKQTWEFSRLRPEDFKPITVLAWEPPKPGTYSGMTFPESICTVDGVEKTLTIEERARAAHWECYYCGGKIQDTREIRQRIMDSYDQEYRIKLEDGTLYSPKVVVFYLPKECARDNTFEDSAKAFLKAKAAKDLGNPIPMRDWHLQERAIFYDESMSSAQMPSVVGSYDPNKVIENEHHRGMLIDCQKHLTLDTVGTFWIEVYAADKFGNSFQLERGFITSWDDLRTIQDKWKIPNHYVCIDGRKWTPEILQKVASFRRTETMLHYGRQVNYWSTWRVLLGDAPARSYPWPDRQHRVWSQPTMRAEFVFTEKKIKERVVIPMYRWSNLSVKDQLHGLLIGGEGKPRFVSLARNQCSAATQMKEQGDLTYERQMSAEIRMESKGKPYWEKLRPNNHYWDLACMRVVRMAMDNLLGHEAAIDQSSTAVGDSTP